MGNYDLLHTAFIYDRIPISEYVSTKTGLTVVIAEFEKPTVSTGFHILTEAFDDDGLPNALRYLIFMGSEDFPYKNIPNLIATNCLGIEITSKIRTIYTSYNIETLGAEGLLSLLPIIGDHILFPLLTEEAFTTEIHHITGKGVDAGTMYKDLQTSEEFVIPQLHLVATKTIYPGKCSYTSNTKGTTKSLRELVTISKIRDYHKKFYKPENLKIVIIGNVKPEEVFKALEKLEEKIVSKGVEDCFQRPFQSLPPPLAKPSTDLVIPYPADSEKNGYFYIVWRTVSCITDSYMLLAITVLLEYFTESPDSPLLKEFVNNEENDGRVYLEHHIIRNKESCMYIFLNNVPIEKMTEIKPKLLSILKNIIDYKNIDMECLKAIITQHKLKQIILLENYPCLEIQSMVIRYMAFGENRNFQKCFNPLPEFDKLLEQPLTFWLDLIKKYFIENENVVVLQCLPSKEEKEKEKVEPQKKNLTETELKEKEEILEKAIAVNEREPPPELLISIPFPNIESIKFQHIERYNSDYNANQRIDLSQAPVFTYFDCVNASTVFLQVFLGTSDVPLNLQNYLSLFFECLMGLPIQRNDGIVPHEEVEKLLDTDLVYRWTDPRSYTMPFLAAVTVEVEASKYDIGLVWLRELLYKTVFTVERLKFFAAQMLKEFPETCCFDVLHNAINAMCFSKDSYLVTCEGWQKKKFLLNLIEKLDGDDNKEVLDNMEKVRKIITQPSKLTLYVAANLDCLKNPIESINDFLPPELQPSKEKQKLNSVFNYDFLQFNDLLNGCIIGEIDNGTECDLFCRVTKTITSCVDPDYPALMICIEYLNHDQGPLRLPRQIQCRLRMSLEEGLLYLTYSEENDVIEAYEKIKEIVFNQLETSEWKESLVKSVQRSALYDLIDGESTTMDLILTSRQAYLHNMDYTYNRKIFDSVTKVTTEDLNRVGKKYVAPLFDHSCSKTAIIAHPSKIIELADGFKKLGLDLEVYNSVEESFLNKL